MFIALSILGVITSAKGMPILFASIALLGILYGITWPMYGACAGDYFPREVMGTVMGAWTPLYGSGAILVHWITGIIRDRTGTYDQTFIICIAMAAISVLLMSALAPRHRVN